QMQAEWCLVDQLMRFVRRPQCPDYALSFDLCYDRSGFHNPAYARIFRLPLRLHRQAAETHARTTLTRIFSVVSLTLLTIGFVCRSAYATVRRCAALTAFAVGNSLGLMLGLPAHGSR